MTNYLNEAAYKRWLRQYHINLANYIEQLNALRLRIDDLPGIDAGDPSIADLQAAIDAIDVHLDIVLPRDFSEGAKPLEESEKFFENCKVLSGLIFSLFKRPDPFMSIYQIEKNRVMKEHIVFKFKEKLLELKKMVELQEAKQEGSTPAQESALEVKAGIG